MRQVFELIQRVAPYDVNVCIEGETGTGKELVATLLHQHSQRSHGPFITLNCGAIPETLIESELFGHEKGAFTGAHQSLPRLVHEGKFRADLLFRLNHLTIHLPPLRERKDDLEVLSHAFLSRLKLQLNRKISGLSQGFLEKLKQHSWPGNVRELEHVLRQAAILEDTSLLSGRFFQPTPH